MIRPTGSKLHRIWKCPASAVLTQVEQTEQHPLAGRGKMIHSFLEIVRVEQANGHELLDARALALAKVDPSVVWMCSAIDLDAMPAKVATEVSLAYDWKARTARELGRNMGRLYATPGALEALGIAPLGPTEIGMTLDLLGGQVANGLSIGYVGDYKTGHSKYPPPDRFAQTMLGAVASRALWGIDECVVELLMIHDDGDHHNVRRKVDEWDLDTFADELEAAMSLTSSYEAMRLRGEPIPVREGSHCDYCGAFKHCPAKVAIIRSIPAEMAAIGGPGEITRAKAADAWMVIEKIEEALKAAKAEICGIAAFEEIPLPDGRVIGHLITSREVLDGKTTAQVVEQWYDKDAVEQVIDQKASKDALRKLVVARIKPGEKIETRKGDGRFDAILGEIRRRGGAATNSTDNVKPHTPKKRKELAP